MFHWSLGWYCSYCATQLVTGNSERKQKITSQMRGRSTVYVTGAKTCTFLVMASTALSAKCVFLKSGHVATLPRFRRKMNFLTTIADPPDLVHFQAYMESAIKDSFHLHDMVWKYTLNPVELMNAIQFTLLILSTFAETQIYTANRNNKTDGA